MGPNAPSDGPHRRRSRTGGPTVDAARTASVESASVRRGDAPLQFHTPAEQPRYVPGDFKCSSRHETKMEYSGRHGKAPTRQLFPMVPVKHDDRPAPCPGQPRDGFFGYPGRVLGDGDDIVAGIPGPLTLAGGTLSSASGFNRPYRGSRRCVPRTRTRRHARTALAGPAGTVGDHSPAPVARSGPRASVRAGSPPTGGSSR